MADSKRSSNSISEDRENFLSINETPVDEISLPFFYKPHSITLLTLLSVGLFYVALRRNDGTFEDNLGEGLLCVCFLFLAVSVLAFPNGPFTRPHPAIWRLVFGLSVLYLLSLVFILFQRLKDVKSMLIWLTPELKNMTVEFEGHADNCNLPSWEHIWNCLDIFVPGHFLGWACKALLIRNYGIAWTISVMWEVSEIAFRHLLPNFAECWWDAIILDVVLCNGLGIWFGMWLCRKMEIRDYHWASIRDIRSTRGKIKRAVMQFTPASWTHMRWLDPGCAFMRILALTLMCIVFQLAELNFFFLKYIFKLPTGHVTMGVRTLIIALISAPSIRQYYSYVTDHNCNRVGTQCWVFCAVLITEAIVCIKFGFEIFKMAELTYIAAWLFFQVLLNFFVVYVGAQFANWHEQKKEMKKTLNDDNHLAQGDHLTERRKKAMNNDNHFAHGEHLAEPSAEMTSENHQNGHVAHLYNTRKRNHVAHRYNTRKRNFSRKMADSD